VKLAVRHDFDCSVARYWEMYWDPEFDEALRRDAAVQRDLIEERTEGAIQIRRLRFTPDRELPSAVAALIGAKKLVYEQENRWDSANNTMHWRVIPTFLQGKFDAKGLFKVVPLGADACQQVVEGEIVVNVPLVGGQIEKAVVAEVQRSYDKTAATCREWLESHR
jgi:hypothetical protein